jgi:putative transposase
MPRALRIHLPGGFYHATLRGNHQQDIFRHEADRHLLNRIVARAIERYATRLHAYCWMSNHLHLLMQVGSDPLARPMRQIACEFARAMQLVLTTTGHYFERRYHATLVDGDAYLLELIRYIHLNPVRAGLVEDPARFPWSSHHAYVNARAESWVTTDFVLRMFAAERACAIQKYRDFLAVACTSGNFWEPMPQLVDGAVSVLGSDEFVSRIAGSHVVRRSSQKLPELISEACRRFEIDLDRLLSPVRDSYLVKVRAWIAHQADQRGVATRSAVARALGRSEATLRHAIKAYPGEVD